MFRWSRYRKACHTNHLIWELVSSAKASSMLEAYNPVLHFDPIAIVAKIVDRLGLWAGSLVYLEDLTMHGRLADTFVSVDGESGLDFPG